MENHFLEEDNKTKGSLFSRLKQDSGWLGLIPGLAGPFLGFIFYYQVQFADSMSLSEFIRSVSSPNLLTKVMSLSVIMNLPIFFAFIFLKYDKAARSVLGATIVYAIVIAYLKFLA